MIAAVSPQTAVKRAAARRKLDILDSGYGNYGASHTKKSLAGWLYGGGSAKEDIQDNLSTLRQRCRDLYMGVPLATGALKTCRTNVIGSGLRLKSQIDYEALEMDEEAARDLERKIEREFSLWADSTACDLERLDNFYELQQLAFLNWLMSGDVIATLPVTKRANMPYDLRICLIEADRLSNPNGIVDPHIIGGVETNDAGEVVAYHISKHHPLSYDMTETGWTRVEAWGAKTGRRNVLHIMNRERIGQRRGVPFLAPVIEALKQLGRYTDAELVAAVVSGMFTVFIGNWGDFTFYVSADQIKTFDSLKWDSAAKYSTHDRHLREPLLEFTGTDVETITFTMFFSVFLGVNPIKEIASLLQAMRRGEVNRLVIGPKAYGTNKWVITKLSNSLKRFDRWGNLLVASVNVTMQSYAVR